MSLFIRFSTPLATVGVLLSLTSVAFADALPPNGEDCEGYGKTTGAACVTDDNEPGVCQPQQFANPEYQRCEDAGIDAASCTPDETLEICVATSSNGTSDGGHTTTTAAAASTPSASEKNGCNVGAMGFSEAARASAPFALAALVPIVLRRRRRQTKNDAKKG